MITRNENHAGGSRSQGFTLIETLLATSLFLLLVGASIMSMEPASRGSKLDQGAVRLESILRFARAEAANMGRRVRVSIQQDVEAETNEPNQIRVSWEPEPLNEPDVFQDLSCAKWEMDDFSECASVEQVSVTDSNEVPGVTETATDEWAEEFADLIPFSEASPITFNPDGSSDSAEIVLAAREKEDARRIAVRVMGLTGVISREVMADCKGDSGTDGQGRTQEISPSVAD